MPHDIARELIEQVRDRRKENVPGLRRVDKVLSTKSITSKGDAVEIWPEKAAIGWPVSPRRIPAETLTRSKMVSPRT